MKILALLCLLFTSHVRAQVYDAFMCYTGFDTVVLFGVLKPQGTLRINYHRLESNPTTVELKVNRYERSDNSIIASAYYQGKEIIKINSQYGRGVADIDLTPFLGTEDVLFSNADISCYFGKFED